MKAKLWKVVVPGVLLPVTLMGCRSCPGSEQREFAAAALAYEAARTGALFCLANDPDTRPWFEAAQQALAGLLSREDYDPAKMAAVLETLLQRLNTDALRGEKAALLVSGVLVVFDVTNHLLLEAGQSPKWVRATLVALEKGFRVALEQPARRRSRAAPNYRVPGVSGGGLGGGCVTGRKVVRL